MAATFSRARARAASPRVSMTTARTLVVLAAAAICVLARPTFVLADGVITSGEIVFEMGSMTVGDLEGEWETKFLGHMKSPDFFDVASFPTATLKVKSFKEGQMKGDLTIKGVTRPIAFPAEVKEGKYVGKASFNRTEFGITYGSGSFFEDLGDKMINDTVDVEFSFAVKGD